MDMFEGSRLPLDRAEQVALAIASEPEFCDLRASIVRSPAIGDGIGHGLFVFCSGDPADEADPSRCDRLMDAIEAGIVSAFLGHAS
jgi:hypothetical protein